MNKKSNLINIPNALSIHLRAVKDIQKLCPGVFLSVFSYSFVCAIKPYVTIYLSACFINELASFRRPQKLVYWITMILAITAFLSLLQAILKHWKAIKKDLFSVHHRDLFTNQMLRMDFADADKRETYDTYMQICQNENWYGWGLYYIPLIYDWLIESIFGILGAITLTISLFTSQVPKSGGSLVILNHPVFLIGILVLMALLTYISPFIANKATALYAGLAEEIKFGNRLFGCFGRISSEHSSAMDIRMYHQFDLMRYYESRENHFGATSNIAKMHLGPIGVLTALSKGISSIFSGIVYVYVCLKAWAGAFGIGSVTQYIGAVTALSQNIALFIRAIGQIQNNALFLETIYGFLDIPNAMYQGSLTTEKRADRQYEIEFKDVSFKYPNSDLWALRHVNMKFKVGNRLAVVGENGSGKTTFIKLLCRLYDPQEGQILLNGIDIRKYNYRDYMEIFSVVFQDFQLVSQPLGANVAGSAKYDTERVKQCLIDAGFGERLDTLSDGLDTYLYKDFGKEGIEVSGGEAQKIAIARALYKNAPFIILDEPTAALDPIAEAEIYSKFNDIAGDKTAIYISHRLSSCKFCDEIAVFHEGAVIQQGTHDALVSDENGKYYELWNAQAQYYTKQDI